MAEEEDTRLLDEEIDEFNDLIEEANKNILEEISESGLKEVINELGEFNNDSGEVLSSLQKETKTDDGLSDLNLSNENSKRLAVEIQSAEGNKGKYFSEIRSEILESQKILEGSRLEAVSNFNTSNVVSELLVKNETYASSSFLHVKSYSSNGETLGHNMKCALTNKRMILIDSNEDIINTISGPYKGRFPKYNNMELVSQNYFSILFKPFRLSDVTDIAVKFRFGSETKKTLKRGWSKWALIAAFILPIFLTSLAAFANEIVALSGALSVLIVLIMLFIPFKSVFRGPIFITKIRQLEITIVNSYTKYVDNLVLDIEDSQSIESVLEWTSILQSLSSATTD